MADELTTEEKNNLAKCKEFGLPDHAELIDDVFYVWETRFGLFQTMTKEGRRMSTGGTKDGVIRMTRWTLKCEQEGTLHLYTRVINTTSGVKL